MKERFAACLLGGAVGDALGYTVEFMHWPQIESWFGPRGIIEPQLDSRTGKALITDDTQMSLFTLDGIIWAYTSGQNYVTGGLYPSYLRWLYTQTGTVIQPGVLDRQPHEAEDGILTQKELFFRRAPGSACLSALRSGKMGTRMIRSNDSKGCGGMMRAAPIGCFCMQTQPMRFVSPRRGRPLRTGTLRISCRRRFCGDHCAAYLRYQAVHRLRRSRRHVAPVCRA